MKEEIKRLKEVYNAIEGICLQGGTCVRSHSDPRDACSICQAKFTLDNVIDKIKNNIKQPEGLCLMWYRCLGCGREERLWNSRPRVTPFAISCIKGCPGKMQHVKWEQDEYAPNYEPKKGERIFVDWSIEACEKFKRKYIEDHWDKGEYPMKDRTDLWKTKEEALQYFLDDWKFGDPTVITI